jgi:hypothetical protein
MTVKESATKQLWLLLQNKLSLKSIPYLGSIFTVK